MAQPPRAVRGISAYLHKIRLANGRVVSSHSKTGDSACSQAVSDWKTRGMTPETAKVLARCRANFARRKAEAGQGGEGQAAGAGEVHERIARVGGIGARLRQIRAGASANGDGHRSYAQWVTRRKAELRAGAAKAGEAPRSGSFERWVAARKAREQGRAANVAPVGRSAPVGQSGRANDKVQRFKAAVDAIKRARANAKGRETSAPAPGERALRGRSRGLNPQDRHARAVQSGSEQYARVPTNAGPSSGGGSSGFGGAPKGLPAPASLKQLTHQGLPTTKPIRATRADYLKPKPNTVYESNGYLYRTDAAGRLVEASGQLKLKKAPRNSYRQVKVGRSSGVPGDEGGHAIGAQFGGLGEGPLHMVPQARKLNRGARSKWTAMERGWADALKRGDKVTVRVEVHWPSGARRPNGFTANYEIIDGKTGAVTTVNKYFPNL